MRNKSEKTWKRKKKQFALWVMLEIKKYLKEEGKELHSLISIKWKSFVNDFTLQFLSVSTAFQLVLKFLYLSNELMSVCLLNYDLQTFPSIFNPGERCSEKCISWGHKTDMEKYLFLVFVIAKKNTQQYFNLSCLFSVI